MADNAFMTQFQNNMKQQNQKSYMENVAFPQQQNSQNQNWQQQLNNQGMGGVNAAGMNQSNAGYNPGNLGDYMKQYAMQPTGQYNPQPYGLPSYGGFQNSPVGQSGKLPLPGQPAGTNKPWFDPYNMETWMNPELRGAAKSFYENVGYPQQQAEQNAMQNAFNNMLALQNLGGQQNMNAFNMGITGRQTGLQEWSAQEQAKQAAAQFGLDTNLANWRYGKGGLEEQNLANQRTIQGMVNSGQLTVQQARDVAEMQRLQGSINSIGFGREQLGEQARASKAQEALRATQLQNELMAARYAAFGQSRQPRAQWTANWG